jgi:hypothetical protein
MVGTPFEKIKNKRGEREEIEFDGQSLDFLSFFILSFLMETRKKRKWRDWISYSCFFGFFFVSVAAAAAAGAHGGQGCHARRLLASLTRRGLLATGIGNVPLSFLFLCLRTVAPLFRVFQVMTTRSGPCGRCAGQQHGGASHHFTRASFWPIVQLQSKPNLSVITGNNNNFQKKHTAKSK